MRKQDKNLISFKIASAKYFVNEPLAKKKFQLLLEQPVQDVLMSMDSSQRLTFVRQAIGEALVKAGYLTLPS